MALLGLYISGLEFKNGVSGKKTIQLKHRHWFFIFMAVIFFSVLVKNAYGQEALRNSIAGDLAAESRKQAANSMG